MAVSLSESVGWGEVLMPSQRAEFGHPLDLWDVAHWYLSTARPPDHDSSVSAIFFTTSKVMS